MWKIGKFSLQKSTKKQQIFLTLDRGSEFASYSNEFYFGTENNKLYDDDDSLKPVLPDARLRSLFFYSQQNMCG